MSSSALITAFLATMDTAFHADDLLAATKQTEADNVKLVQAEYDALLNRDFNKFLGLLAEEVQMQMYVPEEFAFRTQAIGKQQVLDAVLYNFGQLEDQRPEIIAIVAQGDLVVVHGLEKGRIKANQKAYQVAWIQIHTMRAKKLVSFKQIANHVLAACSVPG